MGNCPLIKIILWLVVSGLLLWLAVAGFTKVGEEIRGMRMEKADLVAGSRPVADLNYASERRVPRGPDPIHNRCTLFDQRVAIIACNWFRRAGNSRQPPGQA